MEGARDSTIENLEARLNEINDEWILRKEVLDTEYDALLTAIESEMDTRRTARDAARIESEAVDAGNKEYETKARLPKLIIRKDSLPSELDAMQVKMEALDAKRAMYDAEKKAHKAAKKAAKLELVEAWHKKWEVEYDEGLRKGTTVSGMAEICSICSEEFVHRKGIGFQLSCAHQFHKICLKPWMKSNNTCPLCGQLPLSG